MAKITTFLEGQRDRYQAHDEISATYFSFERDGQHLLQIDTHGRDERQIPGKVSQSIQLDKEAAQQLVIIIKKTFSI
jgi:hypothetical protein